MKRKVAKNIEVNKHYIKLHFKAIPIKNKFGITEIKFKQRYKPKLIKIIDSKMGYIDQNSQEYYMLNVLNVYGTFLADGIYCCLYELNREDKKKYWSKIVKGIV